MPFRTTTTSHHRAAASRARFAILLLAMLGVAGARAGSTSGSVAVTSDYLFRGVTQTNGKPALQGGVTHATDSGFYVGGWGSSISWLADSDPGVSSQVELDGFVGYSGTFGDSGVGFDVGANYYWYPGDYPAGYNSPDTLELYAGISYGILSARYSRSTTDLFGVPDSRGSSALDLAASWEFAPGWTLDAGVGRQWVKNARDADYGYWKAGLARAFDRGFGISAAYHDTNIDGLDNAFVLTLSKAF